MKIVTVIPIAKGIPREALSYFSAKEITLGTIVSVVFGKRNIKGIVVATRPVRDMKTSIRKSAYSLKNISEIHKEVLPSSLFIAGQKTAQFSAQPVGAILKTMLPDVLLDHYIKNNPSFQQTPIVQKEVDLQSLQVPLRERISIYKTIIRENLAKKKSTMIIVPTIVQAEKLLEQFSQGISEKIFVIHSKKTKKYLSQTIKTLTTLDEPVVYIATAPFVGIIRNDWETLVIEESSSPHYRYAFRPIFDIRVFIETFAHMLGTRLIYGDTLIDPEMRFRITNREIIDMRTTWHIAKPEDFSVIDMKPKAGEDKKFSLFDESVIQKITTAVEKQQTIVFLATRKGGAPMTVCSDCGTPVVCPTCETPMVLYKKQPGTQHESRRYMCHACMQITEPIDTCRTCGGWRLTTLGISTGVIAEALEKIFPKTPSFLAEETIKHLDNWKQHPGSFLVATPMILPYLETIDIGCIVSCDTLLAIPTLSGGYQALRTSMMFLEKITSTAIIQTRSREHEVMQALANENIFDFIKSDLASRDMFFYPPYRVLIKITASVKKKDAQQASNYLETLFKNFTPDILIKKSPTPGDIIVSALIKVDTKLWRDPESEIQELVHALDHSFICEINPEGVL